MLCQYLVHGTDCPIVGGWMLHQLTVVGICFMVWGSEMVGVDLCVWVALGSTPVAYWQCVRDCWLGTRPALSPVV